MKIMVGIDLHRNNVLCGLKDESSRRFVHKKRPCDLAAIVQLLRPSKNRIATIAVESTFNWYWLVDGLQDHGCRVVLANPAAMQNCSGMKHTDDVSDACFLSELLRLNLLPTGHLASPHRISPGSFKKIVTVGLRALTSSSCSTPPARSA